MGSTRPYYRRALPLPQPEADFTRDIGLKWVVWRARRNRVLGFENPISVKRLMQRFAFAPAAAASVRKLLGKMMVSGGVFPYINLLKAHIEPYGDGDRVAAARRLFDKRTAAALYAAVRERLGVRVFPEVQWKLVRIGFRSVQLPFPVDPMTGEVSTQPSNGVFSPLDLLELKFYGNVAASVHVPLVKCLAAMAYPDYFGSEKLYLRDLVSQALIAASPGWCGTFGPDVRSVDLLGKPVEGNYDMPLMHLIPLAYRYFDELSPAAAERLVSVLLPHGRIHRINLDDTLTSGGAPNDWSRAGYVSPVGLHKRLGETENHILMIHTARYLANQLLYQRTPSIDFDNRRNGFDGAPSCTALALYLLRNILLDDFSEYNAKSYQHETRTALLNLCSYAYDHEVRLAARMALDYVAAHIATSSGDCRRMVPFRRRNDERNSARRPDGVMTVGLLEWVRGSDPLTEHLAMQTGATRAYEHPYETAQGGDRPFTWSIASDGGDSTLEMLSDYRIPVPIHDLFVTDSHRRFFQRLHRTIQEDVEVTGRNADNHEIYAGSPSYLISAGGSPAFYAIDPLILGMDITDQDQQRGVAVTTSFMPIGNSAGNDPALGKVVAHDLHNDATNLIQFSIFSQKPIAINFGVAPDFACGHRVFLPAWCIQGIIEQHRGKFSFVNKRGPDGMPGFYLALLRDGDFTVLEAFDTWLHPELSFDQFIAHVWERNKLLSARGLHNHEEAIYTTENGNRIRFVIWNDDDGDDLNHGARVDGVEYSGGDPADGIGDAGTATAALLRGTIMNSRDQGVVEITNPFLGNHITLDLSDPWRPRRTDENGIVEAAGDRQEVWVDFDWKVTDFLSGVPLPSEGDFFRPYTTLAAAIAAVANGGVIKIMPGSTAERAALPAHKHVRLVAPIGDVRIGVRQG
jgi:hypothetical protein